MSSSVPAPATLHTLWPDHLHPDDLSTIEAVPLAERGLPESTDALLAQAAALWPARTALAVLPEATRLREPVRRTFTELLGDVHRAANFPHTLGVRRGIASLARDLGVLPAKGSRRKRFALTMFRARVKADASSRRSYHRKG